MAASDEQYLLADEGDTLSASIGGLASYDAATTQVKNGALLRASLRVDAAGPWQGRKYDPSQLLEFPRIPYAPGNVIPQLQPFPIDPLRAFVTDVIWDQDPATGEAIVPDRVKRAVLYEANNILKGSGDELREKLDLGLTGQTIGSGSENYAQPPGGVNARPALCRDADLLMRKYKLRSGQIL